MRTCALPWHSIHLTVESKRTVHLPLQVNDAYCGPASAVTVLNTLGVGQPLQTPDSGLDSNSFAYYDQDNVFDEATEQVKRKVDVRAEASGWRNPGA